MPETLLLKQDQFISRNLTLTANREHSLGGYTLGFTGGNIGFGIASPTAKVHLYSTSTTGTTLSVESADTGGQQWQLLSTGSGNAIPVGHLGVANLSTSSYASSFRTNGILNSYKGISFCNTQADQTGTVMFVANSGGYLDVVKQGSFNLFNFTTSAGTFEAGIGMNPLNDGDVLNIGFRNILGSGGFIFSTGTTKRVNITSGGDVGIGSNLTPTARLHVVGSNDLSGTYAAKIGGATTTGLQVSNIGSVIIGSAAIATTATDGFLYVPTCAGTPTGTPTAFGSTAPIVIDSTNNKMYIYSGGAWVALN